MSNAAEKSREPEPVPQAPQDDALRWRRILIWSSIFMMLSAFILVIRFV